MLNRYLAACFLLGMLCACHRSVFKEKWIRETAPGHFTVRFETSRGDFEAAFTREWSPKAVDRVYAQVKHGFYNHTLFYRVRKNYVVQFGADDQTKMKTWNEYKVPDEPVLKSNERATISFANDGKESRGNDLFINLKNNSPRLDTIVAGGVKGYPGLGIVTKGMNVVDSLYGGYGDAVFDKYDTLLHNRTAFLQSFPKLDSLQKAYFIRKK